MTVDTPSVCNSEMRELESGPRRIAEGDQADKLNGSRGPRGYRQNPEALFLKFVNYRSRSWRRSREGNDCCVGSLDDALCNTLGICRSCLRCLLGWVEWHKCRQLWQTLRRLLRGGRANRRINRVLTALRTGQSRHAENVGFVETWQWANAGY